MRMGDFKWHRNACGSFVVTYKRTGRSVTAIPQPGKPKRYCIPESPEIELDQDGRAIPKKYDFWGVESFCRNHKTGAKIDTPTREGLSHA